MRQLSRWDRFTMSADYERAKAYALGRLGGELAPWLTYHSLRHTRDDVLPAAERLAEATGVDGDALLCLTTAALFHDIGFLYDYEEHERESIAIAHAALPDCGYGPQQIETIAALIAATKMPQRPQTLLAQLLCDADLDLLGRDDFWELNRMLLDELHSHTGRPIPEEEWLRGQTRFLEEHVYFSPAARALRTEGKTRNATLMRQALCRLNGSAAH